MILQDTLEALPQAALDEFRATLRAIEAEIERGCYRYARDRIGQWMFVDCGPVDDVVVPAAGVLSSEYARRLIARLKSITDRATVTGRDIYRKVGTLSDSVNFLAEQEEERESRLRRPRTPEQWTRDLARTLAKDRLGAAKSAPYGGLEGSVPGGQVRVAYENRRVVVRFRSGTYRPGSAEFSRDLGVDADPT